MTGFLRGGEAVRRDDAARAGDQAEREDPVGGGVLGVSDGEECGGDADGLDRVSCGPHFENRERKTEANGCEVCQRRQSAVFDLERSGCSRFGRRNQCYRVHVRRAQYTLGWGFF